MSAECTECGADLSYDEDHEMYCEVCRLKARIDSLQSLLDRAMQAPVAIDKENT